MSLGEKLISERKNKKLTQDDVANNLGVTRQTVSNWELNQTRPDLEQAKELSKLFNISLDELVDNEIQTILTEKVSNVERLAGLIYGILKWLLILIVGFIILSIISTILFAGIRGGFGGSRGESSTVIHCNLENRDYAIELIQRSEYDENNVQLSKELLFNVMTNQITIDINLDELNDFNDLQLAVTTWFEDRGGICIPRFEN